MSKPPPNRKKRPADFNQRAYQVFQEAIGKTEGGPTEDGLLADTEPTEPSGKNPAAVALGRLGGSKGGKARAAKLTKQRRSEIARKAAIARWARDKVQDEDESGSSL